MMTDTKGTYIKSQPLQTERLSTGHRELLRTLVVHSDGDDWEVPIGATTDFSTIPAIGRAFIKWSRVDIAGVVHDRLYHKPQVSRARADKIWRLVAQAGNHKANAFQAWAGWIALRGFGGLAWATHRGTNCAWAIAIFQVLIASAIALTLIFWLSK